MERNKKLKQDIHRESIGGKYYWVKRDSSGRIETKRRAKKGITKEKVVRLYKKNRSFHNDVYRYKSKHVTETIQPIHRPLTRSVKKYQILAKVSVDGKPVHARSFQVDKKTPVDETKNQAYVNLFSRVCGILGRETDFDDSEVLGIMDNVSYSRIYYAPNIKKAKA